MTQDELLRHVVSVLERLKLRYFVTGSIASIYYGEPRLTNDIDVVVDLPERSIPELCAAFPAAEFYLSDETAARAVRTHGTFNVLHPSSGLKVDLIVPEKTLFNHHRFQRVRRVQTGEGLESSFSSAEDVILMKMEFFRRGGSDKHLRDITGILKLRGDRLDTDYIENWADQMGLETIWRTLRSRVKQ